MTPAERDRFEKCLVLAKQGATAGERAAAHAAAERIAVSAGMTLAEAKAGIRGSRSPEASAVPPWSWRPQPGRRYAWSQPKEPVKPVTVEELLRQKAETEAWRKRATAAADRRLRKKLAEQAVYEAQQREMQAERDREWAQSWGG